MAELFGLEKVDPEDDTDEAIELADEAAELAEDDRRGQIVEEELIDARRSPRRS